MTPLPCEVTGQQGTERAFTGWYYDYRAQGIYGCVGCGLTRFTSDATFDSGSGWPSSHAPAVEEHVRPKTYSSHGMHRVEVPCPRCDAHLGYVFEGDPEPTGLRCGSTFAPRRFREEKQVWGLIGRRLTIESSPR